MIGQRVKFNPYYLDTLSHVSRFSALLRGEVIAVFDHCYPGQDPFLILTVRWDATETHEESINTYNADNIVAIPGKD